MRVIIAFLLFFGAVSVEATTTFTPQLTIGIGYSDNIELEDKGAEQAESIFELNPGFLLQSEGRTHTIMARYRMRNIFYSEDSERDVTYNQLQADATKAILGETFFIDGSILHTQGAINPDNFANLNGATSSALFRNETYSSISPYLKHIFDSSISSELRYELDKVSYENILPDDLNRNNLNHTILLNFDSTLRADEFSWIFGYSRSTTEYEESLTPDVRQEKTDIMLQYRFSSRFAMYSDIGYENNDYGVSGGEQPVGGSLLAGLVWAPSSRTYLKAGAGKRFYGNTYFLDIRHRSRRLEQTFEYFEDIVTLSQVQRAGRVFNDAGVVEPSSFNALALNADVFIRKRAEFDIGYSVGENRIGMNGYFERMENQTNVENTGSQSSKRVGLYWTKRLTPQTRFRVSSELQRRINSRTGESQIKYSRFSLEQRLAQNASLSFSYTYSNSTGSLERQNYVENYINSSINLEW